MPSPVVASKLRIPNTPSMPVERLDGRLDAVWQSKLAVVTAPAGSGKTTLLTRLAARAVGPVGWYRAEGLDSDETALLRHVEAALRPGMQGATGEWATVEDAANALDQRATGPVLLIVDDLHTLQGTPAERALERLIGYAPSTVHFAIASRDTPGFNLSRLRVTGELLELTGDDLRLRSWEVERLFRDFYAEPLPPEELAGLARRTEGWAAGLQLFHLATRGRTADERRRMLAELNGSARLMREYLARNVLRELPDDTRRFLIDTSVLGRLSGPLCDRLLERSGSADVLAELQRRRMFTQPLPEDGEFRYHEVMRTYLHEVLLEELGEEELHSRFSAAGELLADAGAASEALEAYCRGEDWDGARRLLARRGAAVADQPTEWLDSVPGAMVRHDPWLLLAGARRARSAGRLREAAEQYQRAEMAFGSTEAAQLCRSERQAITAWTDGSAGPRPDAFALLRSALRADPAGAAVKAQELPPPVGSLIAGLSALAAGNVATARTELIHAAERHGASRATVVIASLGAGVAGALMGQPHAALEIEGAVAAAEAAGIEWLARVGRASLAITGAAESVREANVVAVASKATHDEWGAVLAQLCRVWGELHEQQDAGLLDELVVGARALDAPVLEAWARSLSALAGVRAGEPDARDAAIAAASVARTLGVAGARLVAHLAVAEASTDPIEEEEQRTEAEAMARETGLRAPGDVGLASGSAAAGEGNALTAPLAIRLLGGFELDLGGAPADLSAIRPRARMLLRLLALNAGRRVHHETIEAALWPDADPTASARNLHVAVSALRRILEPAAARGSFQLIRREGDAYVVTVPEGAFIDLLAFDQALAAGHRARAGGDAHGAERHFALGLAMYRGDLLPEDGPADWVAERRDACRLAAVDAAQALAELLLERGDAAQAARVCTTGLRIERYHDPLWRLLISARDLAGDQGAAKAARLSYDRMLAELGVSDTTGSSLQ
ncbi:MAG TPA: BTAD domain-containing putative transcriptional regulator [Candidatus Limnocylindrales bacterium]